VENNSPIVLLDESEISGNDRDLDIIDLTIDVFSEPLRTYIGFRDCEAYSCEYYWFNLIWLKVLDLAWWLCQSHCIWKW